MSDFSFIISDSNLTDLSYTGTLRTLISTGPDVYGAIIVPDRGFQRQAQHRVLSAKFGDGYEQRVRDGINTKKENFNLSFNNRSAEEINLIAAFFDLKAATNFTLTITGLNSNESIKVVCDSYNIAYIQTNVHSLQTAFRRVYEP